MSQENVDLVRSNLEPFKGIDVTTIDLDDERLHEAFATNYSPDFELRTLDIDLGLDVKDLYRGFDGLLEYLRVWLEPFSESWIEPLEYIDGGDFVFVRMHQWGTGDASGARVELDLAFLYEVKDGQIMRLAQFNNLDAAREAAQQLT